MKEGKAHVARDVPFATILTPEAPPPNPPAWSLHSDVVLTIPKIPYWLFRQIVAWQRKIAAAHKCESTTSLFLIDDEENPGQKKWVAVPFFQQNHKDAMTAEVAYDPVEKPQGFKVEENERLLAQFADHSDVHATLHNHVNYMAGQSGTDVADEKGLPGPHITIGNLNQKKLDFHARLSTRVDNAHRFVLMRPSDIIAFPMPPGGITTEVLKALEDAWLTFDSTEDEYPAEWDERFQLREKNAVVPFSGNHNPMVPRNGNTVSPSNGTGPRTAPDDEEDLENWLMANRANLTPWPYGFLEGIDISSPEAFKTACSGMNLIQIYALRGIMYSLGPDKDYNDVLVELQTRAQKVAAASATTN